MAKKTEKIRVCLRSYDHSLLDLSAAKIVEQARKSGAKVSGPIPLPTRKVIYTILRSPHKYKDAREQFEICTHKRIIDITNPTKSTMDVVTHQDLAAGVDIELNLGGNHK